MGGVFTGQIGAPASQGGFLQPGAVPAPASGGGGTTPTGGGTVTPLQWTAVRLLTGQIVCDLPDIELTSQLAVTIGQLESAQVVLHLQATTNPDWPTGTQPGGSALIAWTGDPTAPTIVWGGIVAQRVRLPGSSDVQLGLVTPEAYLDGCEVGTYTATNLNQDTILASLMAFASGTGRVPIALRQLAPSIQTQTVAYTRSSQVTVYAALQALSGVAGGPEWSMDWVWNVATGIILPRLNYGIRIGTGVLAGAQPNVTIEPTDMLAGSAFSEDFSAGHGANDVIAYGSASSTATSTDVPFVESVVLDTKGRPLWTYAYSPNQTVSDLTVLKTYAIAAVTQMQDGAQPLAVVLSTTLLGKQFGVDWNLGDDLGWSLSGMAFPTPLAGVGRCIGYRVDATTITPILKGVSLG